MAEKRTFEAARDEHAIISGVAGKKVFVIDAAGNIVNNFGSSSGNVTLNPGPNFIGIVTVANPSSTAGNTTLNPGPNQIGAVTVSHPVSIAGNLTLSDPKTYIGLVTATPGAAWSDPKTYIGLVTIDIGANNGVAVKGNVTLSDSKNFVGLATVVMGTPFTPAEFFHVMVSTASGQVTQFPGQVARWSIIQADPNNAANAYLGASGVTTSLGFPLQPGQMTGAEVSNLNQMWLANATGTSVNIRVIGGN